MGIGGEMQDVIARWIVAGVADFFRFFDLTMLTDPNGAMGGNLCS
jgi:hypothetical protein